MRSDVRYKGIIINDQGVHFYEPEDYQVEIILLLSFNMI